MADKIAIGVPFYGPQSAKWWIPLVNKVALFPKMGLKYAGLITAGVSTTDRNRNDITELFLNETDADWLFWIDADNVIPDGTIRRLLDMDRTLASGLYYGKGDGHIPIAYAYVEESQAYRNIGGIIEWERGEIIPVDAGGMGCILTHRSVFEDIRKNYEMWQMPGGGVRAVHKDDTKTPPKEYKSHKLDGKMIEGQLRQRMMPVVYDDYPFPYFMSEYGRTEDMFFFECAARVGHKLWIDTSIEAGHIREEEVKGIHFRTARVSK